MLESKNRLEKDKKDHYKEKQKIL